jgi:ribonuclease VapC
VIFALLKNEPINMELPDLRWATMSTVNIAEVWTKLAEGDEAARRAGGLLLSLLREIVPFTEDHARLAGELQMQAGVKGISLGDRACLALALSTGAEVYTADRVWARLKLPCSIHLIR